MSATSKRLSVGTGLGDGSRKTRISLATWPISECAALALGNLSPQQFAD
jgi:hypothetical protein